MVALNEGIYFVTDPAMTMRRHGLASSPAESADSEYWHRQAIEHTVNHIDHICAGGVRVIQLRWKNVDAGYFLQLCTETKDIVGTRAQILVNDRVDVFLAARCAGIDLDGVHIGQSDLPVRLTRELIASDALLGWSAESPSQLQKAAEFGSVVDYVGVGTVRHTATKTDAPDAKGIDGIARIARDFPVPVVAIGGICYDDLAPLGASPVRCAAIVSALVMADDPYQSARDFQTAFFSQRTDK